MQFGSPKLCDGESCSPDEFPHLGFYGLGPYEDNDKCKKIMTVQLLIVGGGTNAPNACSAMGGKTAGGSTVAMYRCKLSLCSPGMGQYVFSPKCSDQGLTKAGARSFSYYDSHRGCDRDRKRCAPHGIVTHRRRSSATGGRFTQVDTKVDTNVDAEVDTNVDAEVDTEVDTRVASRAAGGKGPIGKYCTCTVELCNI
jgi:hypothetical protein